MVCAVDFPSKVCHFLEKDIKKPALAFSAIVKASIYLVVDTFCFLKDQQKPPGNFREKKFIKPPNKIKPGHFEKAIGFLKINQNGLWAVRQPSLLL